jgi:uncharacterized protein RhaS with RHS repeats
MGARVYDPDTGTFTQPDPIEGGGANAYGYTDGDPINELDLSGNSVVLCSEMAGSAKKSCNGALKADRSGVTLSSAAHFLTSTAPAAVVHVGTTVVNKVATHPVGDLLAVSGAVTGTVTAIAGIVCMGASEGAAAVECADVVHVGYGVTVAAETTAAADYSRKHGP